MLIITLSTEDKQSLHQGLDITLTMKLPIILRLLMDVLFLSKKDLLINRVIELVQVQM